MKKLYRNKGTVHPSPSSTTTTTTTTNSSNNLYSFSYLPATILTLVAALSSEDKQVLAYLLSCSTTTNPFDFNPTHKKHNKNNPSSKNDHVNNTNNTHVTCFTCYCFSCYTTYWARWDSSPNRQLIHEIIDALEDSLLAKTKNKQGDNKKYKKKNVNIKNLDLHDDVDGVDNKVVGSVRVNPDSGRVKSVVEVGGVGQVGDETGEKQGIVRKMVSFVWGSVWGDHSI